MKLSEKFKRTVSCVASIALHHASIHQGIIHALSLIIATEIFCNSCDGYHEQSPALQSYIKSFLISKVLFAIILFDVLRKSENCRKSQPASNIQISALALQLPEREVGKFSRNVTLEKSYDFHS